MASSNNPAHDDGRRRPALSMSSSELLGKRVKRVTMEMPQDIHLQLKRLAVEQDVFMRDIVVVAVKEWLDRNTPPPPQ